MVVDGLTKRLQEAITLYQVSENCLVPSGATHPEGQVSQQQVIHEQIIKLSVSTL